MGDRIACAVGGAICGAIIGVVLTTLFAIVGSTDPWIIASTAIVYAAIGFVLGPQAGHAVGSALALVGSSLFLWLTFGLLPASGYERQSATMSSLVPLVLSVMVAVLLVIVG